MTTECTQSDTLVSEYEQQAIDFCKKTGTVMTAVYIGLQKHFPSDTESRPVYIITLTRNGGKSYMFKFGDSINSKNNDTGISDPTYSVLSCLTKYNPGTLDDFVDMYGYEVGHGKSKMREVIAIYKSVVDDYTNVRRMFGDVMDELQEIA